MELTREETIKALESCNTSRCEFCPLNNNSDCNELRDKNALHYLKEKEPAPSANGTSSEVKTLHLDDTTKSVICQVLSSAMSTMMELYQEMSEEEQKAFDLGTAYKDICFASAEL